MAGTYQFSAARLVMVVAGSLLLGGAAGGKLSLVREHNRLERNKTLVRRSHTEVWSGRDRDSVIKALNELYSPKFILANELGKDDSSGIPGLIGTLDDGRRTMPDWTERPEELIAEGDLVAARYFSTGTQVADQGPSPHYSPGIPNRGKSLRLPAMELFRVTDGKLTEQWDYSDQLQQWLQLGVVNPDDWPSSPMCARKGDRK
jgi:predicted ester cyclase